MAGIVAHLSVEELGRWFRGSGEGCEARHVQAIWFLSRGLSLEEVCSTTGLGRGWLCRLVQRYNAHGPEALGDQRRGNGARARLVTPELLDKLRRRLADPPGDGGVWTAPKVAVWRARGLDLVSVYPQRAWEALKAVGWTIQVPRPRHRAAPAPSAGGGAGGGGCIQKSSTRLLRRKKRVTPAERSAFFAPTSIASA